MPTNFYFQPFPTGITQEQLLVEDLVIEAMQQYGMDVFYLPRSSADPNGPDPLYGEDTLKQYKVAFPIEVYLENVTGMDGEQITSITSLTDKLYVLGTAADGGVINVGILKLNDDGVREMSTLVPTTAAATTFTGLKAIRRLNDSQFVVGYGQSIRVIDARNGIAVPFITAGAEQTKADAAIKVIADKIKALSTSTATTTNDAASEEISTAIIAVNTVFVNAFLHNYTAATFKPLIKAEIARLLTAAGLAINNVVDNN